MAATRKGPLLLLWLFACTALFLLAVLLSAGHAQAQAHPTPTPMPTPAADRWREVRQWSPYPFTRPLPPKAPTPLDGIYVRFDPRSTTRPPCRRCPAYPPEGGIWKVQFDRGAYYVYHPRTGWRTLGSYTVDGDTVTIFNDPQCHLATGNYRWNRTGKDLSFALKDDDCELGTRPKAFTSQPWQSCQPPNREAAVTGHWHVPEGCE